MDHALVVKPPADIDVVAISVIHDDFPLDQTMIWARLSFHTNGVPTPVYGGAAAPTSGPVVTGM
jgi:inosine-uridine nucleoside N-ribohydrolase